jgi:hypothetical protein
MKHHLCTLHLCAHGLLCWHRHHLLLQDTALHLDLHHVLALLSIHVLGLLMSRMRHHGTNSTLCCSWRPCLRIEHTVLLLLLGWHVLDLLHAADDTPHHHALGCACRTRSND